MSDDPKRLIVSENNELGLGLASARRQLPGPNDLSRLARRLSEAGIALPAAAIASNPAPPARLAPRPKPLGHLKWYLGLGGVIAIGAVGAWLETRPAPPPAPLSALPPATPPREFAAPAPETREPSATPTPMPTPRSAALPREPNTEAAAIAEAAPPVAAAPAPESGSEHAVPRETPRDSAPRASAVGTARAASRPPVAASPGPVEYGAPNVAETPTTELELVKQARNAVNSDPARAYALTERCRAEFPRAVFGQERDYIAITALARLGRDAQARALASTFRTHYPHSVYAAQLQRLLGDE